MPITGEAETSLALSAVVASVAVLLAWLQWRDYRSRAATATETDRRYFALRDVRRTAGIVMLGLLAPGVYVGSRVPVFVTVPTAARGRAPNPVFLAIWVSVFAVLFVLLGLAIADWIATRRYAERQRHAMAQERLELLREALEHERNQGEKTANGFADL